MCSVILYGRKSLGNLGTYFPNFFQHQGIFCFSFGRQDLGTRNSYLTLCNKSYSSYTYYTPQVYELYLKQYLVMCITFVISSYPVVIFSLFFIICKQIYVYNIKMSFSFI